MSWYQQPGSPPPGWYPDPAGSGERWWDGALWAEHGAALPEQWAPPPPDPRPGPATSYEGRLPPADFWIVPSALLLLVAGSVAPWATLEVDALGPAATPSLGGTRGDAPGVLTMLAGLSAGGLLALWLVERVVLLPAVAATVAFLGALVALYHAFDPATATDVPDGVHVGVGWGVWVTLAASLAIAAASVVLALRSRKTGARGAGRAS